ncbi:MAG: hypothetical protein S4CHLAM37_05340 [Chlamydiia bacterium]|nr:hypothetical protein [Chlamydiia bacterium]
MKLGISDGYIRFQNSSDSADSTGIKVIDEKKLNFFEKLIGRITGRFTKLKLDVNENLTFCGKSTTTKTVLVDRVSLNRFEDAMTKEQKRTGEVFKKAKETFKIDLEHTDKSTLFSHHLTLEAKQTVGQPYV